MIDEDVVGTQKISACERFQSSSELADKPPANPNPLPRYVVSDLLKMSNSSYQSIDFRSERE